MSTSFKPNSISDQTVIVTAEKVNKSFGKLHVLKDIDLTVSVDRTRQRLASLAHKSQALPSSVLWRRLELLGNTESLRWLHGPLGATVTP